MIVRRNRPSVGQRTRTIVRRQRGVVPPEGPPPGGPRFHLPQIPRGYILGAIAGSAILMVLATGVWAWRSTLFDISQVEVVGNERVSTVAIMDTADLTGDNMFTVDLGSAQERVFSLPLVSDVQIQRKWPNTIYVIVEERQAWGTWEQAGITYTIDREGYVLGTIPPASGSPAIRSEATGVLVQGDRVDFQAVAAAVEIYDKLPQQLGTTVREVAYLEGKGVQVTTLDGQVALFGDSSSIAYKLAVWAALQQEARVQGISYTSIDLRYGNHPVVQ